MTILIEWINSDWFRLIVAILIVFFFFKCLFSGSPHPTKEYKETSKEDDESERLISPLEKQFLKASEEAHFNTQNLLNHSEIEIYWVLVKALSKHHCVNPQVSLGETLTCDDHMGYRAINSKRCDFVITDKRFKPLAVIEYQGSGHYLAYDTEIRDRIKRNALERAGIAFIELHSTSEYDILKKLNKHKLRLNQLDIDFNQPSQSHKKSIKIRKTS